MSQNLYRVIVIANIIAGVLITLVGYHCIINLGMIEQGIIPAIYIKEAFILVYQVYVIATKANRETLNFSFQPRKIRKQMIPFTRKFLYSLFGIYGEYFSYEVNTIMSMRLSNIKYLAVWIAFGNITDIFFFISLGLNNVFRTNIGQLVGQKRMLYAKKESIAYFVYTFFISLICSVLLYAFRFRLAYSYFNNTSQVNHLVFGLVMACASMFFLLVFYAQFSICRLINEDKFFFKVMTMFFPLWISFFSYFVAFMLHFGIRGILFSYNFSIILVACIFFYKIYFCFDWSDFQ